MDAIVVRDVFKQFKKTHVKKEITTLKSELVNLVLRRKKRLRPVDRITALQGVTLSVPRGKTVGLVGRNGSGKSTLLKLITGIYTPTSGSIEVSGRISALLDLGAGFHPDFTGRENILINGIILGMTRAQIKARTDEIIAFSELGDFVDEPVRTYSSGMFMRLAFAVATHVDPEILIIDEILAVGDEHFSRKSMAKLTEFKASGKTILLVTHDLSTVEKWCDLAAWIDGGVIRRFGDSRDVVGAYQRAIAVAESQHPEVLMQPGTALPALPAEDPGAKIELQVTTPSGHALDAVEPEDALVVRFRLGAAEGCEKLAVELSRPDGLILFSIEASAEIRKQGGGAGPLELRIDRLGVVAGEYLVRVRLAVAQREVTSPATRLRVIGSAATAGLLSPRFTWAVPGGRDALEASGA